MYIGPPSTSRVVQSLIIDSSGVIAAVEATQSTELIIAMICEMIIVGMALHRLQTTVAKAKLPATN